MPKHQKEDNIDWNNQYDICRDLLERETYTTPDFFDLKLENEIPIFVYGSLKQGGFLHDVLEGHAYLGVGQTHVEKFWMEDAESFPCVFELQHGMKGMHQMKGRIQGELYVVDPLTMLELDRIESNGKMYKRRKVYCKALDQGTQLLRPSVQAWMYIACPEYWSHVKLQTVKPKMTGKGQVYEWLIDKPKTEPKRSMLI